MVKKTISVLLLLSVILSFIPAEAVMAEKSEAIELNYTNLEMNLRSDLAGKFTNDESGAYKSAGIQGSFIEGKINVDVPGVYHFYTDMLFRNGNGIVQMSLDGEKFGEKKNTNSSNNLIKEVDFGSVYIADPGEKTIRFTSKGTESSGYNLGFKSLRAVKESLKIDAVTDKVGNIFIEGDEVKFQVTFENTTNKKLQATINPLAESSYGTVVNGETIELDLRPNEKLTREIVLDITEKNTYTLRIRSSVPAENEKTEYTTIFSYIEKALEFGDDNIFGVCMHMGSMKKDSKELNDTITLLKQSGIRWVRNEYGWEFMEPEKGKWSFHQDDYVNALHENGFNQLTILCYGGPYGTPHDEESYTAYGRYAKTLAEHFDGILMDFEIWNEWNGGFSNGYGDEEYLEMTKAAYKALKEYNPEIKVVAGGAITSAHGWFDKLFQGGMFDYCDEVSYHPYNMPSDPDTKEFKGTTETDVQDFIAVMQKYGEPKPQNFTEYGWHTGDKYTSSIDEDTQADYVIRSFIAGMVYGVKRIYHYQLIDGGNDPYETEHHFGMVYSNKEGTDVKYGAKPSYVATVACVNKLSDSEFIEEYRPFTDGRIYKFLRGDEEIVVMYDTLKDRRRPTGTKVTISGETANMQAYDIFGNPMDEVTELNTSPVYLVGKKGQFNIDDIDVVPRNSITITFGRQGVADGIYLDVIHDQKRIGDYHCFAIGKDELYNEISMDVDESYISGGINSVAVEVAYYDSGKGKFHIEYDSSDQKIARTESVTVGNTKKWKKAKFYIDDARFAEALDGNDLRIVAENPEEYTIVLGGVRIIKKSDEDRRYMSIEFNNDEDFAGFENAKMSGDLFYPIAGDGLYAFIDGDIKGDYYTEKGGEKCVFLSGIGEALYITMDAQDDILYGLFDPTKVTIEYFDEGKGTFTVAYDVGLWVDFKEPQTVQLTDTKKWKTAEFVFDDCWYQGYVSMTDMRLTLWAPRMGRSPEGIAFRKLAIEVLDGIEEKEKKDVFLSDISGHWSEEIVTELAGDGVVSGYEDNTFRPDSKVNVEEFITLLIQKRGYSVVDDGEIWSEKYIKRALELGIIKENEFDDFSREITRAEMARMVARVSGTDLKPDMDFAKENLKDFEKIPDEFKKDVAGVYEKGIIIGDDSGTFRADSAATRAEAAVILSKI